MKIFITGSTGFIGKNFINHLIYFYEKENEEILITCMDKVKDLNLNKECNFIKGNIRNFDLMTKIINENDFDIIVHFAAQTHVDDSFENAIDFSMDNVIGTQTILECLKNKVGNNKNISKFIHISTDEVYGDVEIDGIGKTEKSLLIPTNPYAASKAGAEMIVNSYMYSFKIPCIIVRMNNVYGPYQGLDKVIPKFINQIKNRQLITIHGDGSSKRSFIHVSDVCNALELIIKKGDIGEIYNIGANMEITILNLAKKLCWYLDYSKMNIDFVKDRLYNDKRYFIDDSKIKKLGFKPKIHFEAGIYKTINHYINKI